MKEHDTSVVPAHDTSVVPADDTGLAGAAEAQSRRLMSLARRASIETSARNLAEVERYGQWIAPGTPVYIPWLPGAPFHHSLSLAQRLRQAGFEPVPHFSAKRLDSRDSAAVFLRGARDQAGVTQLMLVGGDTERAAGPFATALSVIESGLLSEHGIARIGIAAYPEGHPRIAEAALDEALLAKLECARARGIDAHVVTQFCFDGRAIVQWLSRARAAGLQGTVRIGVSGPAKIRSLLSYAAKCGVAHSVRALWSGPVSLRGLLATHGPEEVLAEVVRADLADPRLGPLELHLFSFGGFKAAADWLSAAATGGFDALSGAHGRSSVPA